MRKTKFYTLFISLSLFIVSLTSCVNNDDKEPDVPGGGGGVVVTPENIETGEWEIAYMTQRVRVNNADGADITFRTYGMDGFTIEFLNGSEYMERNTLKKETILDGKYILDQDKGEITLDYQFKNPDTDVLEDSVSIIDVYQLTDKTMVYHISRTRPQGVTNEPAFQQKVFYLRNKKKGPDEFQTIEKVPVGDQKSARVTPASLKGTWEIVKVLVAERTTSSTTWVKNEEATEAEQKNLGIRYVYNTDASPFEYEQYGVDGNFVQRGTFTVSDDVMHYYYTNEVEGKMKDVMSSMAINMAQDKKSFVYTYNEYDLKSSVFSVKRVSVSFKKIK